MTITKELLVKLEIISFTYKTEIENSDVICNLTQQKNHTWTFQTSNYLEELNKAEVLISINCSNYQIKFKAEIKEKGKDYFIINIPEQSEDPQLRNLIIELEKYEQQDEKYGRRKEERVIIGKTNAKLFGLHSLEQKIFINGIKNLQPCSIIDASVHGIQIITPYNLQMQNIENFKLKIDFENPEETVILSAHKIHTRLNEVNGRTFASISCQLLDPINFSWKNRIISIIEIVTK